MAVRTLNQNELAEVEKVFGPGLDVTRVRVNENAQIGNQVGRLGAWLRGKEPPTANAITIFNTSYFPVTLTTADPGNSLWLRDMGWLMHELTHQWQYQHDGPLYLIQAIFAPTYVYAPAGQTPDEALKEFSKAGKKFHDFNREQQGDIVRDYFFALKQNQDVSGWNEYIQEVRTPAKGRPRV
jgi:hypothetical protein